MSQNYNYPSSSTVTISAIGTNGALAPTTSIEVAGINNLGNLTPLAIDSGGNLKVSAATLPLPTGAATEATLAAFSSKSASAFITSAYDYIALTYVPSGNGAGQVQTAVYKSGGSGGSTVGTLTLAYDSSNNLASVTKT